MKTILAGVIAVVISFFGLFHLQLRPVNTPPGNQPAAAALTEEVATETVADAFATSTVFGSPAPTSAPEAAGTTINKYITQPVIERIVANPDDGVSEAELDAKLNQLDNNLTSLLYQRIGSTTVPASSVSDSIAAGGVWNAIAGVNKIDNLANTTISNPTITGGSITASSITGTITGAIDTLSGTIGSLTGDDLTYTRATFDNATTTNFYASRARVDDFTAAGTSTLAGIALSNLRCATYGNGGKLTTDASGNVVCATDQGGSGTAVSGSDTQVQFNDNGSFGASSNFTYSSTTQTLAVTNASTTNVSATYASSSELHGGTLTLTTALRASSGGTGTSTAPAYGQILVGNGAGTYALVSTSSLGIAGGSASGFSTSSADYWKSRNDFFSTTSADYLFSTKSTSDLAEGSNLYFTDARVGAYVSGSSTIPHIGGSSWGNLLFWNGSGWTAGATSSLAIGLGDTTGVLGATRGGTGITSYAPGDILYADSSGNLTKLAPAANGSVLKLAGGVPMWGVDETTGGSGGSDGIFATSSSTIYPINSASALVVGGTSTSSNSIFEAYGNAYVSGEIGVGTTSPSQKLSVAGNIFASGSVRAGAITGSSFTGSGSGLTGTASSLSIGGNAGSATKLQIARTIAGVSFDGSANISLNNNAIANGAGYQSASNVAGIIAGTTTDALKEGANNLYFTASRARSAFSADAPLSYDSGTGAFSLLKASGTANGYLSSADWTAFNNKISSTSLATSADLASLLTDETGSGKAVFSGSPTFTGTLSAGNANFSGNVGIGTTSPFETLSVAGNIFTDGALTAAGAVSFTGSATTSARNGFNLSGGCFAVNGTCISGGGGGGLSNVAATYPLLGNGTSGSRLSLAFGTTTANTWSPLQTLSSGVLANASSTIGNGLQGGGLTISGGATTTGSAYIGGSLTAKNGLKVDGGATTTGSAYVSGSADVMGRIGIGTSTPVGKLTLFDVSNGGPPSLTSSTNDELSIEDHVMTSLAFGNTITSPYALWIQGKNMSNNGDSYPLALNPLGGGVGIGTTTPVGKLTLYDNAGGGAPSLTSSANDEFLISNHITTALAFGNDTSPPYDLWIQTKHKTNDGASYPLALNPLGGNVGIGTSSPGSLLSVGTTNGINFSTGTSTFSTTGGIDISSGCFSIDGTCVGSGASQVSIDSFGGSCSASDNTQALLDAVNSVSGPVVVTFPESGCSYTFTQSNAITFTKPVWLVGAGTGTGTELRFAPTSGSGTIVFLNWDSPVSNTPTVGGGLSNLTIWSSDQTYTKVAIAETAISQFAIHNVNCGPDSITKPPRAYVWTGGTGSTCLVTHGWDIGNIDTFWAAADKPIEIGINPYSPGGQDHWHWHNIYAQSTTNVGDFADITVQSGVYFSETTFDGYQAWVNGTYGFDYDDNAAINSTDFTDSTGGSGYAVGNTVTLAGGSCTTQPQVTITAVSGGAVTAFGISNPGVCTGNFPSPASQSSTSGSGSGATFAVGYNDQYELHFSDVRTESGTSTSPSSFPYTFFIAPEAPLYGLSITNSTLDGNRNGIYLKNVVNATISGNFDYGTVGPRTLIDAESGNGDDQINLSNNDWGVGAGSVGNLTSNFTGLCQDVANLSSSGTSVTPSTASYAQSNCGISVGSAAATGNVAKFENSSGTCYIDPTNTSLSCSSDQRLKTNIEPIPASSTLESLLSLTPVSYNWRTEATGTPTHTGFIAQAVLPIFPNLVSQEPDGYYTLNYAGFAPYIVSAIQEIAKVSGAFEQNLIAWLGDTANGIGDLFAKNIHAQNELCVGSTCVDAAEFQAMVAASGASQDSGAGDASQDSGSSTNDTPPQIKINGENPAIINVGTTYSDLGATITGPESDTNLGIKTFLNGTPVKTISIDTSATATDTIEYVATDQNGLTSTSTRVVIIQAPSQPPPSSNDTGTSTSPTTDGGTGTTTEDQAK